MNRDNHPISTRSPAFLVSREGLISLAVVVAVHLLVAVWIKWSSSPQDITPPMTGILVAGNGGKLGEKAGLGNNVAKGMNGTFARSKSVTTSHLPKKALKIQEKDVASHQEKPILLSETQSQVTAHHADITHGNGATTSGSHLGHAMSENGSGTGTGGNGTDGNGSRGTGGFPGQGDVVFLQNPKPPYPAVSRQMGEEGVVMLSVMVDANGTVSNVKVTRSSGFPRLDASALNTVRHWRYVPAKKNGVPIAFRYVQPIRFSLND